MKLHNLHPKHGSTKSRKRVGRGNASGHGTFSTRGCKGSGQRAGGNIRPGFEGGQTPLIMRLPKLRGFTPPSQVRYQVLNVEALNAFEDGTEVTPQLLLEKRLVRKSNCPVKILGEGKLTKKITLKVHAVSASARDKIVKIGGRVL